MSRRASLYAKENPGKRRPQVRFPDELVFLDNVKENDMPAMHSMLRRASVQIDINGIGDAGMTALHQAALDGNLVAVRLLVRHGADVNKQDDDTWTPLHAACAEGHVDIARFLLEKGADKTVMTDDGERPIDLVDSDDFAMIGLMLDPGLKSTTQEEEDDEEDLGDVS